MKPPSARPGAGFTLIELLVVVALFAIVLALAVPSFTQLLQLQRLRGVSSQLHTDFQFARSEASARQDTVGVTFGQTASGAAMSCYTIHTCGNMAIPQLLTNLCSCDCTQAAGSRCIAPMRELRTVEIANSSGVELQPVATPGNFAPTPSVTFSPINGHITAYFSVALFGPTTAPTASYWVETRLLDSNPPAGLRSMLSGTGRAQACSFGAVSGTEVCP